MTPALRAVYDELLSRAARGPLRAEGDELREQFLRRTCAVSPGESVWAVLNARRHRAAVSPHDVQATASFSPEGARLAAGAPGGVELEAREDRAKAAWDDALTRGGLAARLASTFNDPVERALVRVIAHAHRGIFRLVTLHGRTLAVDQTSAAEFLLIGRDDLVRSFPSDVLEGSLFDGRVVAASDGAALLPGMVFHPPDAGVRIEQIVAEAKKSGWCREELCDALLRMQDAFASLSRVKLEFAYRSEALLFGHGTTHTVGTTD